MAYDSPKYAVRVQVDHYVAFPTSGGTTVNRTSDFKMEFARKTKITGVKAVCMVIPNASATNLVLNIKNGTDAFATVTLTTATAGACLDATIADATKGVFAKDTGPTLVITGTATGTSDALGTWNLLFETQEQVD